MKNKVTGIKSVDFKVEAIGNGVVNWNGKTIVGNPKGGKELDNHMIPKLRGYNNETGQISEKGHRFKKLASEIDFKETPLYVSQNCIRHHLFKNESHDMHFASKIGTKDNKINSLTSKIGQNLDPKKLLISISGLLRGYVIPNTQCKRKSPLLIDDFVDTLGNGNFEQFGNSGEKDSNSIYSKTTFGKTKYVAHGSISIEDLQFISLDKKFDRESFVLKNDKSGEELAKELSDFIASLDIINGSKVNVEYGDFIRVGTIYNEPEKGLLLNDAAVSILVELMIEMIEELSIKQAKGWLSVSSIEVDYNDSKSMMRIVKDPQSIETEKDTEYAVYYSKKV